MKLLIGPEYPPEVLQAIKEAKQDIHISMYDWRWYLDQAWNPVQQINKALVDATKRAVFVRIVTNTRKYHTQLKDVGFTVKQNQIKRILHTKIIYIDRKVLFIGSHNMTYTAQSRNMEMSVKLDIEGTEIQTRLDQYFSNIFNV